MTVSDCPWAPEKGESELRTGSDAVPRLTITAFDVMEPEIAVTVAEDSLRSVNRSVA